MRRFVLLFVSGWWLALASFCMGAGFQVTPILQEISMGEETALYQVRNTGESPVTIQVSARSWHQENGERVTLDTAGVQSSPPLITLEPGQDEWVRVTLTEKRTNEEQAFRVYFSQVPETAQTLSPGVRTLIRLDTPLFFQAREPKTNLQWALQLDEAGWHLQVHNVGTRFGQMTRLAVETDGGRRLPILESVRYILPGASESWLLDLTDDEARGGLSLQVVSGGQVQFQPLKPD